MATTKTRYSKQRELILNNLKKRFDHPTAEQVYNDLKKEHPNLSLGTVYRNLNYLAETQQIRKLETGEQIIHYDGNLSEHAHFICQKCHKVYDIYSNIHQKVINELKKESHHQINNIYIMTTGICEHCLDQEKEN